MLQSDTRFLAKGAFHIHSRFSGDGELELSEVKQLFLNDGFNFIAICEHQHDMDEAKYDALVQECDRLSDKDFLIIPGIEFNCYRNHILGIGIDAYQPSVSEDDVVPWIKDHSGFAVWAHPKKNEYRLPEHVIKDLDGLEVWNSKFDGKYAPRSEVVRYYRARLVDRPQLRAFCSVDFHFRTQFRNLPMYCDLDVLSANSILASLRAGHYFAKTASFTVGSNGNMDVRARTLLHLFNSANMWLFDRCKNLHKSMKRRQIMLPHSVKDFGRRLFS